MAKIELTLKELVSINNQPSCESPKSLDNINFTIENGKVLGWEIDGREIAVSGSPVKVVEPEFASLSEAINLITNVARYYDIVANRLEMVNRSNETLNEDSEKDKSKTITVDGDFYFDDGFIRRESSWLVEPPLDPVMIERSQVSSSIGRPVMTGVVHYFVPVNDAAKESWGKPSNEGLLTKEQLKALKG